MFTAATPTLASSLLDTSTSVSHHTHNQDTGADRGDRETWDLTKDIEIEVPDTAAGLKTIVGCGRVVGISGLSSHEGQREEDGNDIQAWVYNLSLHFLATSLSNRRDQRASTRPRAIVVQYYECRTITREGIQEIVQRCLPNYSTSEIEDLLGNIQIYRVFDFDEIQDAVDQVSDLLYELQQQNSRKQQQQDTPTELNSRSTPLETEVQPKDPNGPQEGQLEPTLLILEGVDRSLEEIIRASNPVAGHARLVPLLRTLTVLTRTYVPYLTVVVVNSINLPRHSTSWAPLKTERTSKANGASGCSAENFSGQDSAYSSVPSYQNQRHHPNIPVSSIFPDVVAHDAPISHPSAYSYSSLLARSLDQGFDIHLLVSKFQDKIVVEVAKDRVGERVGKWCFVRIRGSRA